MNPKGSKLSDGYGVLGTAPLGKLVGAQTGERVKVRFLLSNELNKLLANLKRGVCELLTGPSDKTYKKIC